MQETFLEIQDRIFFEFLERALDHIVFCEKAALYPYFFCAEENIYRTPPLSGGVDFAYMRRLFPNLDEASFDETYDLLYRQYEHGAEDWFRFGEYVQEREASEQFRYVREVLSHGD